MQHAPRPYPPPRAQDLRPVAVSLDAIVARLRKPLLLTEKAPPEKVRP